MDNTRTIVVVGGVAGGATAAAKARREDEFAKIIIYERGPYLSFANCGLPYYIGGEISEREKLILRQPEDFKTRYQIDAYIGHEVMEIDRQEKKVLVRNNNGDQFYQAYDKLILSQGAAPISPTLQGVDLEHVFTLRNIPDSDAIMNFLVAKQPKSAVVVGGGFIGLEMAEALFHRGLYVHIIERSPHIMGHLDADMAAILTERSERETFKIHCDSELQSIHNDHIELSNGQKIQADLVLLGIGVKPELELAQRAGLEIGQLGGILTNEYMQSSDPDIFAVGDSIECKSMITGSNIRVPLAGPANRQGRVAGANATGCTLRYSGALGTAILRLHDQTVASTGLNMKQATQSGYEPFSSFTRNVHHVGYYPGAKAIDMKIIADKRSGQILGAQAIGEKGVDRRIDVLAMAISNKAKLESLEETDLCYSPPYGAANDPVNMAGFVAHHIQHDDYQSHHPSQPLSENDLLLDVREPEELTTIGKFKNAMNIPLGQLRNQLHTLPKDKTIVTTCMIGQRGYIATKILSAHGYKCKNLIGGYTYAKACGFI